LKRILWAATGIAWTAVFLGGADQVASNTFIDRLPDGTASPDALFRYVASHHTNIGALLVTLAVANVLFVVFGAYLASLLRPSAKPRWLPTVTVDLAAVGTLTFWFADLGTASIWFATARGAAASDYRWISSAIDRLLPFGGPVLIVYIGLFAYLLPGSRALPDWVAWFSWVVAVIALAFSGLAIVVPRAGAVAFISVLFWMVVVSGAATWSTWRMPSAAEGPPRGAGKGTQT
jgi:hypothetical protein